MIYSKSTGWFYDTKTHKGMIPSDSVSINDAEYLKLLDGQSNGKIISCGDDGRPILKDLEGPSKDSDIIARIAEIKAKLSQLDADTMRPARALRIAELSNIDPSPLDIEKLKEIEESAIALRNELRGLTD